MPAIVLLGLAVFVVGIDSYIVAAVLPAMADDLREPVSSVGLVASAYALPVALLSPVFGPLSDKRGRQFAMLLGLTIFAVAASACFVAPSLPLLLGARAINGIGAAILLPAAFAAAGDLPTRLPVAARSRWSRPPFRCRTCSACRFGALAATLGGWRAPFALIAAVAVVAFIGVATSNQVSREVVRGRGYAATFGRVIRDRQGTRGDVGHARLVRRRDRTLHLCRARSSANRSGFPVSRPAWPTSSSAWSGSLRPAPAASRRHGSVLDGSC